MTLQELKNKLEELLNNGATPSLEVFTEGCDCDGDIGEVTIREYTKDVWKNGFREKNITKTIYLMRDSK